MDTNSTITFANTPTSDFPEGDLKTIIQFPHTTIHHVPSSILSDIIFGMLLPRALLCVITMVCNEWNRRVHRSSIHRERYWRQQLSSSTRTSLFIKHIAKVWNWKSERMDINHSSQSPSAVGKERRGWCHHRVVAHSTLRDRWRTGRYKQIKNPLPELWSSYGSGSSRSSKLMCNGSYLLGLSGRRLEEKEQLLVLWDLMNDSLIKRISIPSPGLFPRYRSLIPISESSMCVLLRGSHKAKVTLVNMNSGDWSKPTWVLSSSARVIASHAQPNQPMAYHTTFHNNIEEWDLVTMIKVRDIVTQCNGHRIALNDDHTCIARAGK
jgi:hypothetical protein